MRIAYVCADPGVPVFGRKGCSVHVQEMLRAFLSRGAEIDLFATRWGGDCPPELAAVRLHEIGGFRHPADSDDDASVGGANRALLKELQASGPFDLVYERYSLWSCAGMEFARRAWIPGVLEVNAPLIEEQARYRRLDAPALARRIAGQAFGTATVLCAVSSQVASYLERFPSARGRVHVVHNGVDPARFPASAGREAARRTGAAAPRGFTVGFVGSLKPWHGVATLAAAFARLHRAHPDSRLLVVGDGPERENLAAQLAAEPGDVLAATCLTGAVSPGEIPQHLSRMDVAVAPYPDLEHFYFSPLKLFEYMAAALPVVASRVGDLPLILRDGIDGLLCAPDNAAALAAALDRLRADPALCRRMGEAARAAVLERYTWDGVVRRVLALAGVADHSPSEEPTPIRAAHGPSAVVA